MTDSASLHEPDRSAGDRDPFQAASAQEASAPAASTHADADRQAGSGPLGRGLVGPRAEKPIALALQGGGAHGAFTWGVLDALIEDGRLAFEAITGASAGAMNAVVMVDGWLRGGPDGARERLEAFWREVSVDADLSQAQQTFVNGVVNFWKKTPVGAFWNAVASPYMTNPLNINPLKRALSDTVDFEALRRAGPADLFISATNVWTGKLAVFERPDLTIDHVMASACLPTVFQAVEIDGVPHWDGGYLGNPPLYPLYHGARSPDILLVQINPVERRETPRSPADIRDRLNEITFNANLLRELRAIDFIDDLIEDGVLGRSNAYKQILLHRIDGTGGALDDASASSRLKAQWPFFVHLRDAGREAAKAWLEQNYDAVGRESTLDLKAMYT